MITIQPVVLCGGSGSRLWPLSRASMPKQFLELGEDGSLFQAAVRRLASIATPDVAVRAPLIVANEQHLFVAVEQLQDIGIGPAALLLEPQGRNTAPALSLAALEASSAGEDPVLVVCPSDQRVRDAAAFGQSVQRAALAAQSGAIVLLGVPAHRPETGYGYIRVQAGRQQALKVLEFVEKPDQARARAFVAQGEYYWNAGIFVLKASAWLHALAGLCPDMDAALRQAWRLRSTETILDTRFIRPHAPAFASTPDRSVDHAVLEHCASHGIELGMVELVAGWSDVGSWGAVWEEFPKDRDGNLRHGDVLIRDGGNNLVHASGRLVTLVGVDDLVVVETPDAVLVTRREHSQQVGTLVEALRQRSSFEHSVHRKVHRPWGWYDQVDEGERFKVKRIWVKPGGSLSLQRHRQRAEHWVVVKGRARIVCGNRSLELHEDQSTYIPLGETHRLSNPGSMPLEIIEVQSGAYLGEDDIERLDDAYGRGGGAA